LPAYVQRELWGDCGFSLTGVFTGPGEQGMNFGSWTAIINRQGKTWSVDVISTDTSGKRVGE
jgi:hypothetical protein